MGTISNYHQLLVTPQTHLYTLLSLAVITRYVFPSLNPRLREVTLVFNAIP
jgi:hypothetical protein